jgi:hypothetical protein
MKYVENIQEVRGGTCRKVAEVPRPVGPSSPLARPAASLAPRGGGDID